MRNKAYSRITAGWYNSTTVFIDVLFFKYVSLEACKVLEICIWAESGATSSQDAVVCFLVDAV